MTIDVQRLRIERHVGEQHVVHLRHGARVAVLVGLADLEILEIEAAALVPLDRFSHRFLRKILGKEGFGNRRLPFIYHNSAHARQAGGERLRPRQSPMSRDLRKAQHDGRPSGYCRRTADYRRDPPGRAIDRDQLRISAHHRENRIQFQSRPHRPRPRRRKGCIQFIDQTWLGTMKQDGAALGLGRYADAIARSARRALRGVGSRACAHEILRLRKRSDRRARCWPERSRATMRRSSVRASAVSRPTANSISRIFSAPMAPEN